MSLICYGRIQVIDFSCKKDYAVYITNGKDYPMRFRPHGAFSFYTPVYFVNHSYVVSTILHDQASGEQKIYTYRGLKLLQAFYY